MKKSEAISRFTLDEIKQRHRAHGWRSDWARLREMSETYIARAIAADPDADIGTDAVVYMPLAPDLVDWLAHQEGGPVEALDALLRKAKANSGT